MGLLMGDTSGDYVFFPNKLCARRILCFLKRHYLEDAAHQLERETAVFFDMSHLEYLATTGRWDELASYVRPFLPSPRSPEATAMLCRINMYCVLGTIFAGDRRVGDIDRLYPLLDDTAAKADPQTAALHAFFHDVRKRQPRDVEVWMQVWQKAAERLKDLALKCPELKGKLHLHVPQYAPKRSQINLSGVRSAPRVYKGKGNKPKASDIICLYERKRHEINQRLSGFSSNGTSGSMISDMQIEPAVPEALGADATVVAGMLGGDGSLGNKAGAGASKSSKRKMCATPEADTEASARTKILRLGTV